ncbi:stromelysin-3-like protein [Lates japonicus]|uniref:Stromelysin-3-like protein n=1 Tax=Lates japonicus TaxID=270547 RepID=A0AAD3RA39_LATJO|nr:stromelysin-3-like protein [Lates japonicus]
MSRAISSESGLGDINDNGTPWDQVSLKLGQNVPEEEEKLTLALRVIKPPMQSKYGDKASITKRVSEKFPDLKKRGKVPHAQDLVKETSLSNNTSNTWNRPRCGVPDYPAQKEVHYRGRHRQRRYVLYGGRLDKTDLTYSCNYERLLHTMPDSASTCTSTHSDE